MTRRVATVLMLALLGAGMYVAIRAHRDLTDFQVYRTAATRAAVAEPLYRVADGHYQFKYLPAFAMLTRPLAWADEATAKVAWFAVSFALVAVFLRTLLLHVPDRRLTLAVLTVLSCVVLAKFFVRELALGQTNALFGALLLPAIIAPRGRSTLAGACVGLAIFVKPYAVLFLPWLLVSLPLAATIAAAGVVAAGLLLPAVSYGWTGNLMLLREWWRTVADTTGPNLLHPDNISLASFWAKWIGVGSLASALAFVTCAMLVVTAVVTLMRGRRRAETDYLDAGILLLLVPLLSPQGWDYVLLLAAPVLILVIDRWREVPTPGQVVFVVVGIVLATPLRLIVPLETYDAIMDTGAVTAAALLLFVLAAVLRRRGLA